VLGIVLGFHQPIVYIAYMPLNRLELEQKLMELNQPLQRRFASCFGHMDMVCRAAQNNNLQFFLLSAIVLELSGSLILWQGSGRAE
jgi:hypothetical protein